MARWGRWVLRAAVALAMSAWVGGLLVYGALVLPRLHAAFGVPRTAPVTRQVTLGLNGLGAVAIGLGWAALWGERRAGGGAGCRALAALLGLSTALLALQWGLHGAMSRRMELRQTGVAGFDPLHRYYLAASLVQWFANLGLIALAVRPGGRVGPGRN